MLDHVGERLLHDAVGRQLDAGVDAHARSLDVERHRHAGVAHVVDEARQVGEPGRRCVVALAVAVAQHAEQAAHLGERAAGGGRDGLERGTGLVGPVGEHVGADAGLHGDHRHRVGDDVVQLLGDPQPLLGEHAGRALALDVGPLLGLADPGLERLAAGPQRDPDRPGAGEERQVGERRRRASSPASR